MSTYFRINTEKSGQFERALIVAEKAVSMIVDGLCKDVLQRLPMEIAVEALKPLGLTLERSAGHSARTAHGTCRRVQSAEACQMRELALARAARCGESGAEHIDRGGGRSDACVDTQDMRFAVPGIADIEDTPYSNAEKFVLKEPLTWRLPRSYENAGQVVGDRPAAAFSQIGHVNEVICIDSWTPATQDGSAWGKWRELSCNLADPIRAAPAARERSAQLAAAVRLGRIEVAPGYQERLDTFNRKLGSNHGSLIHSGVFCQRSRGHAR